LVVTSLHEVARQLDRADVAAPVRRFDGLVDGTILRTGVPGVAVAVVHQLEVVDVSGLWVGVMGEPAEVDTVTMLQLATVSRSLTSSVGASLTGSGSNVWDDRVRTHESSFVGADQSVWNARPA
jgi:CubicO group peptidase (beta-lactamase class C family)